MGCVSMEDGLKLVEEMEVYSMLGVGVDFEFCSDVTNYVDQWNSAQ